MFIIKQRYQNEMQEGGEPEASAPENTEQPSGLLDKSTPELSEGEYLLMEGIKGTGEAPDWFKGSKYKSIADQAKAYSELEKKLGAYTGAPEEYSLPEGIESDREDIAHLLTKAKELGLNQDTIDQLAPFVAEITDIKQEVSSENERQALGANAAERIKGVEAFLKGNLKPEVYEEVSAQVTTAKDIMLLEAVIKATRPVNLPIEQVETSSGLTYESYERELIKKDENGNLLASVDMKHRQKLDAMRRELERQMQ